MPNKFHNIVVSNAMFGYLHDLYDMRHGRTLNVTPRGGHRLSGYDAGSAHLTVGDKATYGFVRPFSSDDPVDRVYEDIGEQDYYVTLCEGFRNGKPLKSTSVSASSFYPEKLFLWGEDEHADPLSRSVLLEHVRNLIGFKADPGFWRPCTPWSGYAGGFPTFYENALFSDTNIGATWFDWLSRMRKGDLPEGYEWCFRDGSDYGHIYYETNES